MMGEFASILSLSLGIRQRKILEISHSFHPHLLREMLDRRSNMLKLKGNVKTFRIAEIECRSYLIEEKREYHNHTRWKWIHQQASNALKNIKLLYFSPNTTASSRYGPCQFRTTYENAINRYLEARNKHCKKKMEYKSIVFCVGYTQIFRKEINKVVIVCCEGDVNLEEFPKLGAGCYSKYFMPCSDGRAYLGLEQYKAARHDELSLAFYLPDNCYMAFSMPRDGCICKVWHNPYKCHESFKKPYRKGFCPLLKRRRLLKRKRNNATLD